jgi:hypothetical protein
MPKKSFVIRMEVGQLERLDRARGLVPREAFVRHAIETAIEELDRPAATRDFAKQLKSRISAKGR